MVSTEILIGIAIGVSALLIFGILLIVFCRRSRDSNYDDMSNALLLPEKGTVMPRVNPEVERHQRLEQAMMNARFYLRSSPFILDKYLPDIGRRQQKQLFRVTRGKNEFVMAMTRKADKWPIPLATEGARTTFVRIIKSLEGHPNINLPVDVDYMVEKDIAVAIRPFYPKGSLKDFIHKAKPYQKYNEKYRNDYALNPKLIGKFGRQILEGLSFLKFQGYPYYHLHSGNVFVDENNNCSLGDLENSLVGADPYLISFMKPLMDKVDPEIVTFGCVLYEMAIGHELDSVEAFQLGLPSTCPEDIKKVLETIFNPWFGTPPTIEELLNMNLFSDIKLKKPTYQRVQYTNREKDMLNSVRKCILASITNTPIDSAEFQKKKKQKSYASFSNPDSTIPPVPASISSTSLVPPPLSPALQSSSASTQAAKSPPPPAPSTAKAPPPAPAAPASKAPPPPPPPASKAAPPPPPPPPSSAPAPSAGRSALLDSITGFKGGLKKAVTNDKSGPKLKGK